MASRVLLISVNNYRNPYAVFPLGVMHIYDALVSRGFSVHLYDALVHTEPVEEVIRRFNPDYVGISLRNIDDVLIDVRETFYPALLEMTQRVKDAKDVPVFLGGSGYSLFPEQLLRMSLADYGIQGEGEFAAVELLQALERGAPIPSHPGILQRNPANAGRAQLAQCWVSDSSLTHFPEDVASYYLRKSTMLNVQTQRGCPLHCTYCTYPRIEGKCLRPRNVQAIVDQLKRYQALGCRYFFIVDSVFNLSPSHVEEVCRAILREGIHMQWGCFLRPRGLNDSTVALMKEAGLSHAEFGDDSFSDRVLQAYGKGFTFDHIQEASELLDRHKINQSHFLIFGGPEETEETVEESLENSRRLGGKIMFAGVGMRIYPGTPLFSVALERGVITQETDLLKPAYYIEKGLSYEWLNQRLLRQREAYSNWIYGPLPEDYERVEAVLRKKGVVGPLWHYMEVMYRIGKLPH